MSDNQDGVPAEGQGGAPPSGYPTWGPGAYYPPPPPPPQPPKRRSVGKKVLAVLVPVLLLIAVIAVKVGLRAGIVHALTDHHFDRPSTNGFDYAVGTCLDIATNTGIIKPSDVRVEPCSSPTALARVAKQYSGTKNCPNDHYGTLQGGGRGLCFEDNLTEGSCYQQSIVTHIFESTDCTQSAGALDHTFKVALRRDGVDDPGLCDGDQQSVDFPEPPLTYCLDVVLRDQ